MKALALASLLVALALPSPVRADEPGDAVTLPPVLASAAAPVRQALIIEPGAADPAPRTDALRRDAGAYRDLMRLLGFAVTTLSPLTRPELDAGLRGFARRVEPGADVAIFVLGDVRPTADGVALAPPGAAPANIEAESLRLGDALRRAVERGPRALALVVDGCTGAAEACAAGLKSLPRGVGAVLARRTADAPGVLGPTLLPAIPVEGRTLPQLRDALGLDSSPDLPAGFAFLPTGFLAGLPLACNGVDPELSAEALRGRPTLEPLVAACREAAARYGFSPFFGAKLTVARDQEAARRGLASCADAASYLADVPSGRYRTAVEARRQSCDRPVLPPAPPPPAPTPPPTPLQVHAAEAVAAYFHRHDYEHGDSFVGLARLYGSEVEVHGSVQPAAEHLRRLGAWYGAYDSVRFRVVPGSLDFAGCVRPEDCRLRGRYRANALPAGRDAYEEQEGAFSLRLDLTSSRVLAECGVAGPADLAVCN